MVVPGGSTGRERQSQVRRDSTWAGARETKNTVRYEEVVTDTPSVVGSLYFQKWAHNRLGEPETFTVSVTPASS